MKELKKRLSEQREWRKVMINSIVARRQCFFMFFFSFSPFLGSLYGVPTINKFRTYQF